MQGLPGRGSPETPSSARLSSSGLIHSRFHFSDWVGLFILVFVPVNLSFHASVRSHHQHKPTSYMVITINITLIVVSILHIYEYPKTQIGIILV